MGHVSNAANFLFGLYPTRKTADPLGLFSKPQAPQLPGAPTQDTAANAAMQQQDIMRRRRGIFANIYAGGASQQSPPAVTQKQLLGS